MKKLLIILIAMLGIGGGSIAAQDSYAPSASRNIFDFAPFTDSGMLNLFYEAQRQGRQYPTRAEFEAAGFNIIDVEFARSHVRHRPLIDDQENQLYPDVKNTRRLWMNLPMGTAHGSGGFPGTNAGDDTYSFWNYTHLFGSWNHSFFQAPGAWIDAAHQNGTDILSGIKFFESWTPGAGDEAYSKLITEKVDGEFKYVKPLINILQYFGSDGINYNWEDHSYANADIVAFHKALFKEAEARGMKHFHIGLYTSNNSLTQDNCNAIFGNAEGRTADCFLNYSANDFTSPSRMRSSENQAMKAMGTTDGLYAGVWIVTMNRSWTNLSGRDIGAVLWGEHANSRFWSNNVGCDAQEFQTNYQAMLERAFSGGNRNPANLPPMQNKGNEWQWNDTIPSLSTFGGLATYFPERSAIQDTLPFHTYFNTGIGEVYTYKGKKTHGTWYNMSTQDIVPTYRWLLYNTGTTLPSTAIDAGLTIEDAYMGGSCLKLKGRAGGSADLVLFRTKLHGTKGKPYAKVAVKTGKEGTTPTRLFLIVKVAGAWKEYAIGSTSGKTWEEKTITLDDIGLKDQIDFVGLRVKDATPQYELLVGELQLNDDNRATPSAVKGLMAEVKRETTMTMSVKLSWALDVKTSETGMVYNDEGNVDHFEVLYKNGADGRVSVVSHVQAWSAYIGDIILAEGEEPWLGVRSVSTDLKSYSQPVWVVVPRSQNVPQGSGADGLYYGISEINPDAEGYQIAIKDRYLTSVTSTGASIQDLNYTSSAPAPVEDFNYVDATSTAILKVRQGDEVTIDYKWFDIEDGIRYCTMMAFSDWNINGYFEAKTDELLADQGTMYTNNSILNTPEYSDKPLHAGGYTLKPLTAFKVKVPTDAVRGHSRIRMVFTDAWSPHPGPVGLTAKGFSIDLGLEITGDNPERQPTPILIDEGIADEPDQLRASGIDQPVVPAVSRAVVKGGNIVIDNAEKAWVYTIDGRLLSYTERPSVVKAPAVTGVYIVKMQQGNVIRSQKLTVRR